MPGVGNPWLKNGSDNPYRMNKTPARAEFKKLIEDKRGTYSFNFGET